jgi:monoamine oxidase
MLLAEKGVEVHAFEARDRVGGRLWTIAADGGRFEAGGEWIDADHERVIRLAQELEIGLESPRQRPGRARYRGEESDEFTLWTDAQADVASFYDAADELALDLDEVPWRNVIYGDLDRQNLAELVEKSAKSARGKWWLETTLRSDEGDDPSAISLLGWLCGYLHYLERDENAMSAHRLELGGQAMCERMLDRAGVTPTLGVVLRRVERKADQVHLYFDDRTDAFDHVILALPPGPLLRVVFDPPLSDAKAEALAGCGMSRAIKVCVQFKSAIWLDSGWKGRSLSDLAVMQTWDAGRGVAILTAYVCGSLADRLLREDDPVAATLEEFEVLCPGLRDEFVQGWLVDWIHDPYALGAFSHVPPGFVLNGWEDLRTAEGRLHFAGEHTADWMGFVEGALESAERVASELSP